ncbi:hypothetical protein [Hyunsoonleella rubra]|uniref:Polysaccharide chain length determinant N-terminal domain-containing protein n=1 Tax=Hyunsoonleella rubra TaxID=1737062 RepID=A0ABW5T6Z0_9FLAO
MSKDLRQQPQQNEEMDIGHLFKIIGNLFEKLFASIVRVFQWLYDVLLLVLIHFFKRLKWYVSVAIVGLVIGYFIDKNSDYLYGANMQVQTNYDSARQVYENISYLNQLAAIDRDSVELANRLNISVNEAASIKSFSIEPNIDENDKMKLFSDFRAQLDSLTKSTFTYNDYIDGLTSHSFRTHQIKLVSSDKFVFGKLNRGLEKQLANNIYLDEIRQVTLDNLNRREEILNDQRSAIDSLKNVYLDIRRKESERDRNQPGSGTNLFLAASQKEDNLLIKETELLERRLEIENQKLDLYSNYIENKYIVNIISQFPEAGYGIGKLTDMGKVRIPILLLLITFLIFAVLGLSNYLQKESERLIKTW